MYLSPPPANRKVFDKNFITGSIVELRFPTLITFNEETAHKFAEKTRKTFPKFGTNFNASVASTGISPQKVSYTFESRVNGAASVALHDSAMILRVENYKSYEEFRKTLVHIVDVLETLLDTDFYTRVGYRIINAVPIPLTEKSGLEGYLNPRLLAPLQFDILGALNWSKFEFRGSLSKADQYTFKYGLTEDQPKRYDEQGNLLFMLDYDYFSEDVDMQHCLSKIDLYHKRHFDFFWWALDRKAKNILEGE